MDQPDGDQLARDLRDGSQTQAQKPRDVRARKRTPALAEVQNQVAVDRLDQIPTALRQMALKLNKLYTIHGYLELVTEH